MESFGFYWISLSPHSDSHSGFFAPTLVIKNGKTSAGCILMLQLQISFEWMTHPFCCTSADGVQCCIKPVQPIPHAIYCTCYLRRSTHKPSQKEPARLMRVYSPNKPCMSWMGIFLSVLNARCIYAVCTSVIFASKQSTPSPFNPLDRIQNFLKLKITKETQSSSKTPFDWFTFRAAMLQYAYYSSKWLRSYKGWNTRALMQHSYLHCMLEWELWGANVDFREKINYNISFPDLRTRLITLQFGMCVNITLRNNS